MKESLTGEFSVDAVVEFEETSMDDVEFVRMTVEGIHVEIPWQLDMRLNEKYALDNLRKMAEKNAEHAGYVDDEIKERGIWDHEEQARMRYMEEQKKRGLL